MNPTDKSLGQLKIEPRPDYLYAQISGTFEHARLPENFRQIFDASHKLELHRILIDIRDLKGEISLLARFDAGQLAADLQRNPVRLVVLGREDQVWSDRFFENVANNRGVKTKVTTDLAEALEWLKRDAAIK